MFPVRSEQRGEAHGSRRRRGGLSARVCHLVPGDGRDLGAGAGGRLRRDTVRDAVRQTISAPR